MLIVSADKDLMQLVGPGVAMFDPASGEREERRIGPAEVVDYFGLAPDKVVDIQALAGDSTDNVPGAPGIGVKTAAQLIGEYGDLETLLARAGEIKQPKRREALTNPENVKLIRLSKQLVTLVRDVDVETPLDALGAPEARRRAAGRLPQGDGVHHDHPARRRDLRPRRQCGRARSALRRPGRLARPQWRGGGRIAGAAAAAGALPAPPTPVGALPAPTAADAAPSPTPQTLAAARAAEARAVPFDVAAYQTVSDAATLQAWIDRAYEAGVVAFDTETTSLDPQQAELVGVSLALAPGEACYIPIGHRSGEGTLFDGEGLLPGQIAEAEAIALLKPLLEDPGVLKIGQNVKFDWHVFKRRGVEVAPYDDTMLISYVLDSGATGDGHGMDALSERWLGHKTIAFSDVAGSGRTFIGFARVPIDKATQYAAEDADVTLRLWRVLKPRLAAEGMATVYETLERPLVLPLARMEARGVSIDREMLSRLSGEFAQGMARIEAEAQRLVGARSTSPRPSSSATYCSTRWACQAAERRRPAPGRPRPACSKTSPSRGTNCRSAFSTGASSPS